MRKHKSDQPAAPSPAESAELRRSAFEISIKQFGHSIERDTSGVYCDDDVDDFWQVWNRACDYAASELAHLRAERDDWQATASMATERAEKAEQERDGLRDALPEWTIRAMESVFQRKIRGRLINWSTNDEARLLWQAAHAALPHDKKEDAIG